MQGKIHHGNHQKRSDRFLVFSVACPFQQSAKVLRGRFLVRWNPRGPGCELRPRRSIRPQATIIRFAKSWLGIKMYNAYIYIVYKLYITCLEWLPCAFWIVIYILYIAEAPCTKKEESSKQCQVAWISLLFHHWCIFLANSNSLCKNTINAGQNLLLS